MKPSPIDKVQLLRAITSSDIRREAIVLVEKEKKTNQEQDIINQLY